MSHPWANNCVVDWELYGIPSAHCALGQNSFSTPVLHIGQTVSAAEPKFLNSLPTTVRSAFGFLLFWSKLKTYEPKVCISNIKCPSWQTCWLLTWLQLDFGALSADTTYIRYRGNRNWNLVIIINNIFDVKPTMKYIIIKVNKMWDSTRITPNGSRSTS